MLSNIGKPGNRLLQRSLGSLVAPRKRVFANDPHLHKLCFDSLGVPFLLRGHLHAELEQFSVKASSIKSSCKYLWTLSALLGLGLWIAVHFYARKAMV